MSTTKPAKKSAKRTTRKPSAERAVSNQPTPPTALQQQMARDAAEADTEAPEHPRLTEQIKAHYEIVDGRYRLRVENPVPAPAAVRRKFWIGTLPNSPYRYVSLGGVTFQLYRGQYVVKAKGGLDRDPPKGQFVMMSDEELKNVMRAIANRMVRITNPEKSTGFMYSLDGSTHRPQPGDRRLGEFLYILDTGEMTVGSDREWPEPLITD